MENDAPGEGRASKGSSILERSLCRLTFLENNRHTNIKGLCGPASSMLDSQELSLNIPTTDKKRVVIVGVCRESVKTEQLDAIEKVYLDRSGEISVVKKSHS